MSAARPRTRCVLHHGTPRNQFVRTSPTRWVARCNWLRLLSLQHGLVHTVAPPVGEHPASGPPREQRCISRASPHSLITFLNHRWPNQQWLASVFVQKCITFRAIGLPSIFEVVRGTRPAACLPVGCLAAGIWAAGCRTISMSTSRASDFLASWAKHGIVTLALDR
jgi:hypothetical protein